MIVKSYGNQWIISAEEEGEIQVTVGKPGSLRSLILNLTERAAGYIDYDGWIEPWQSQDEGALMFGLKDLLSAQALYFSIILNPARGDIPPFDRVTRCKLDQGLHFVSLNIDWRR